MEAPEVFSSIESRVPRTISGKKPSARSLQRSREYEEWLLNRKVPHDEEKGQDAHTHNVIRCGTTGRGLYKAPRAQPSDGKLKA